jgi:hypothetical protein
MAHRSVQLVLASYPGYPLGGKSLGALLLLMGIGSFLTGTRYGKPNSLKSTREARREKLVGKSGMRELYQALGMAASPSDWWPCSSFEQKYVPVCLADGCNSITGRTH